MTIRPIADADWPRLQDFVRRRFGQSHIPEWRFHEHWFRNPFCGSLASEPWGGRLLERPDGSLAGALLVIIVPGWFAGRETTLAYLSTGVVEEDARETVQGAALYLWAYRTFPLVVAMGGNCFSAPLNNLLGKDIPGVAMRRFLRLNRAEALDLCRPEERAAVTAPIGPAPALPAGLSADWCSAPPEDYDPLWREVREGLVCAVDRSAAYLRWRAAAPFVAYRFLQVRDGGRLIGLALCRTQETPAGPVARVVDLIARPAEAAAVWRAVAAATAEALLTNFMVVGATQDQALAEAGFLAAAVWRAVAAAAQEALLTDFMVVGTTQDQALAEAGFLAADESRGLDRVPHLLSPVEHRKWTSTFTLGGTLAQTDTAWRSAEAVYFTKADGDRDWPTQHDLARLGAVA